MSRPAGLRLVAAWTVLAVLAVVPGGVGAQEVEVLAADLFAPPTDRAESPGPRITLEDAVRLTIRHQPRIRQAAHATRLADGLYQGERGAFDMIVRAGSGFEYTQHPALPALLNLHQNNRLGLDEIAKGFTELNVEMRDIAAGISTEPPRCPFDIDLDTGAILFNLPPGVERPPNALTFDLLGPEEAGLLGGLELPIGVTGDLEEILASFRDLCSRQIDRSFEQAVLGRFYDRLDFAGDLGLAGVLISTSEATREVFPLLAEITEAVAARARLAHDRLGPLPDDQFRRSISLGGGFTKPFRSGLTVRGSVLVQSAEENFRDKIMDPAFGGLGFPPSFPSHVSLALDLPLGEGVGATAVAGRERSARFTVGARQEQLRHTISEEVYRTVLAYLHLVAAQESVTILEESAERQETYVALTEQLVTADELAGIERHRARARAASLASSLSAARADLATARVSLAEALGLEISTLDEAPLASDAFGELRKSLPAVEDLVEVATLRRRDTRALQQLREASTALADAARANQRRRFDFSVTSGLSTLYESPFPRFLPDEQDPIYSDFETPPVRESAARYYDPRGLYRSVRGRWRPFVMAQFTVNFPFGNNAAKGRLAQAEATLRAARVRLADTERAARQHVAEVTGSLQASAEAIARDRETLEHVLDTRDGSQQLFEAGEATLIDTLLTEDEATQDALTLVRRLQLYLSTLARLKFESGELVWFADEGTPAETVHFTGTEFTQ